MKQRTQILILIVLLIIAFGVWRWSERRPVVSPSVELLPQDFPKLEVENPALHWWKLEASRKTVYRSSGRNPFTEIAPPPHPPKPAPKPGDKDYVPPIPPPPPPLQLPVKYFGYGTAPAGSSRLAFFTDGDDVYIVGEGETLLGRFRILKIGNASLDFEELSSGRQGVATLENQGPTG